MAFQQLTMYVEKVKEARKIFFFDELPWFDTQASGFIQALEHFWNSWASARNDILLIVCGSAASWMINKLINNKGGLYNRVTNRIKLAPFSLHECELFLHSKNSVIDRYQIIQLYMAFGGIPFYWDEVKRVKVQHKISIKSVFLTMITTFGLKSNNYSAGLIQNDLNMDILFSAI